MMNIQEKLANVDKDALRRDGLSLFSKLIRTKNMASLQESAESRTTQSTSGKPKLQVSAHPHLINRAWPIQL
jgi:hypothetical protein